MSNAIPSPPPDDEPLAVALLINRRHVGRGIACAVALLMSLFVVRTYVQVDDPQYGWTRLIHFGSKFADAALPRLQHTDHFIQTSEGGHWGYDGQFYAQLAIDPSLRDPAFDRALDLPLYRARRIGLPAAVFAAAWGKPRRILQVYALSNLFFWFVLLGALWWLFKPRTGRHLLCLCASMLGYGVIASMERSLIDLPAAALAFVGVVVGSWGGCALLAAALLTRETSLLAVPGLADLWQPWRAGGWQRRLVMLALTVLPLAAWLLYVNQRFGRLGYPAGAGNFSLPLQAMFLHTVEAVRRCNETGFDKIFHKPWRFWWLYMDYQLRELEIVASLFFQGLYLLLRRDPGSAFWRMGVCYLGLGAVLGPSVWEDAGAAARVLLPMTLCFYLRLAGERPAWFWPFFLLGGLSLPYGIHEFWTWQ